MDLQEIKDNVIISYQLFLKELNSTKFYLQYIKEMNDKNTETLLSELDKNKKKSLYLLAYDKLLTELNNSTDALRKFNIKLDLSLIPNNVKNEFQLNLNNSLNFPELMSVPKQHFTYIGPDLSIYEPNVKFEGIITHVEEETNVFYIINTTIKDSLKCIKYLENYKENSWFKLNRLPEEGELFGIILDDVMFRAVRENDFYFNRSIKNSLYKVYLVDIGEIINITPNTDLYSLPEKCKEFSSQAICCKMEVESYNSFLNSKDLRNFIHEKKQFCVVKIKNSTLYVTMITHETITPKIDRTENKEKKLGHNCFSLADLKAVENPTEECSKNNPHSKRLNNYKSITDASSSGINLMCREEDYQSLSSKYCINLNQSKDIKSSNIIKNNYSNSNKLTTEQLNTLQEEPLNTTNALKAVFGFVPRDDERICKFYDRKTKSCFKGSQCKLIHVEKLEGGWTRDCCEIEIDSKNKLTLPNKGETIKICCTTIISLEYFYAQIIGYNYSHKLKELICRMNEPKEITNYKNLLNYPGHLELVIAKYRDNYWYRAKVLNLIDNNEVEVFFVDFGNLYQVNIKTEIRKWEKKFDYLPFQAVHCKIFGIRATQENNESLEVLSKMILNEQLNATVMDIKGEDTLTLQLFDCKDFSVGEQLIMLRYAEKADNYSIDENQLIPV